MSDVTRLLERWNAGDSAAMAELLSAVYDELRRVADRMMRSERDGHTLQPTALVNELYVKFAALRDLRLENRRHFYGAAGEAMRRILVDHARARKAKKRGGADAIRVPLEDVPEHELAAASALDYERLDAALAALRTLSPERAAVVDLRYFAGLSIADTAEVLEISPATVVRHWTFARAWLFREMQDRPDA
ncbi:MAG: sigma-70 family RNA polymerase sigma factor [Acidobacteria bacterium]|nr:sigma-70 family RNA polymerase sigma factor [Acidobacteriota bacterium]